MVLSLTMEIKHQIPNETIQVEGCKKMVGPLLVQTHAFNVQFYSLSQPLTYLVLLAMVPQQKLTIHDSYF